MTLLLTFAPIAIAIFTAAGLNLGSVYARLLSILFGDSELESLNLAGIRPADMATVYPDSVYEVQHKGYREITFRTGRQVSNLLAFGYTVRFTSICDQMAVTAAY